MKSFKMQQLINDQIAGINYKSIVKSKKMAVVIKYTHTDDDVIHVNGKEVRKDVDGTWITKEPMSLIECEFFDAFIQTLGRCKHRKLRKAIYTI